MSKIFKRFLHKGFKPLNTTLKISKYHFILLCMNMWCWEAHWKGWVIYLRFDLLLLHKLLCVQWVLSLWHACRENLKELNFSTVLFPVLFVSWSPVLTERQFSWNTIVWGLWLPHNVTVSSAHFKTMLEQIRVWGEGSIHILGEHQSDPENDDD